MKKDYEDLKLNFRIIVPAESDLFYYLKTYNKWKTLHFAEYKKNFKSQDAFINKVIYIALVNKFIDFTFVTKKMEYTEGILYGQFSKDLYESKASLLTINI